MLVIVPGRGNTIIGLRGGEVGSRLSVVLWAGGRNVNCELVDWC